MEAARTPRAAAALTGTNAMTAAGHTSLTAKYRPQTFAAVVGQGGTTRILSQAAAQRRIAPAYLFSGTRGVGKTTVARIFAKAINCLHGPAPEPCNTCSMCRQITAGTAVDVVEIDGASNTGVEHVRRLKEDVGYAPLEGQYKVIIVDEAHMLSKAAFNALLKTLEEPPAHATFILATTEPEKFPITIVSRCQHFVFQRVAQADLEAHLAEVLGREGVAFDPEAVRLIARRGAGSVRDAMSLLSQVLALGSERLSDADVRDVLGMVGFSTFLDVLQAVRDRDLAALHALVRQLVDGGMDLGFFLRELTSLWRDVFLLSRLGAAARALVETSEEEKSALAAVATGFSTAHAHAAWQMSLETQRTVTHSPDPALALELHLVNLALVPELLPVERAPQGEGPQRPSPAPAPAPARSTPSASKSSTPPAQNSALQAPLPPEAAAAPRDGKATPPAPQRAATSAPAVEPGSWPGFVAYLQEQGLAAQVCSVLHGEVAEDTVRIRVPSTFVAARLQDFQTKKSLSTIARTYFGRPMQVLVDSPPLSSRKTKAELKEMALNHPQIQAIRERFQAKIIDVRPNTGGMNRE